MWSHSTEVRSYDLHGLFQNLYDQNFKREKTLRFHIPRKPFMWLLLLVCYVVFYDMII